MNNLEKILLEENKMRTILFESNPYMTYLADVKGNIIYANPPLLERFELSLGEIKKQNIFELITSENPKKIKKLKEELRNGKTVENLELKFKLRNQEILHFEIFAVPLEKEGTITWVLSVIQDITEKKRIETRLKELSDITQHSADSIIKTDKQFRITYMNPAAENLYGWKLKEVRGKTPTIFNAAKDVDGFQNEIYNTVSSGKVYKGTYLNKRKDGTKFHCEMKISPLYDDNGKIYAFTSSQRNVSSRIRAEKRLKEALVKSDFYKDLLAHDMGNILNNIKTSIHLLEVTDPDYTVSNEKREVMDIVKQQLKRAVSLISNVQKLSDIDGVETPIKDINIKHFFERALKDVRSRFQNKNLEIETKIPPDPIIAKGGELLLDVFENILINGCIHNNAEKIQLWIGLSKTKKKGESLIKIEFMDNGIGISDERKEVIFERAFKKEKSRGGTGLGLSLVKKIIKEYGGDIWVENRIEDDYTQGSNFIVLLEKA